MPSSSDVTLESLGQEVQNLSLKVAEYLKQGSIPAPSFQENSPAFYPKEAECQIARLELLSKLQDLTALALGPGEYLTAQVVYGSIDVLILGLLQQLDFFNAVPLGGSATYEDVSGHTKLPESLVRRILRYAMTMRLFAEKEPNSDSIVHTGITAHAVRSPEFQAWLWHISIVQPAFHILPDVLRKLYVDGSRQEVSETELESAFCILDPDRTGKPTTHFEFLQREQPGRPQGWREAMFSQAMSSGRHMPGLHLEQLVRSSFDWAGLGTGATVVDIGGSGGHDAAVLAQSFGNLTLVVQDRPEQEASFERTVPTELRSRVTFQPHDFFAPQPVSGANVYMLKHVLHDWPDSKAVEILRNVAPAMVSPSQRIVLYEHAASGAHPVPTNITRTIAAMDMAMLTMGNGKERSLQDWEVLVAKVGSGLKLLRCHSLPGATASFLEIGLE
ncbi:hypothetical protein PspLS_11350 [Pyricularia sp. CBS 133598]|nr:hypothetical protein PspLS_11350 [Pyricularia sp. CBS 133598]